MSNEKSALPQHLQVLVDLLPLNKPVHRSDLERAYGRTNYARRIRKIVAEYGWDIERHRGSNGANDDWYTRKSEGPIRPAFIRREVPPGQRRVVYERDGWRCKMCGVDVGERQSDTRAQCDHRVPAERGGPSTGDNLQTLCLQCNLKKRQACKSCDLPDCAVCPYAFPEQFEAVTVLRLAARVSQGLAALAREEGVPPQQLITRLIEQELLRQRAAPALSEL